MALFLQRFMSYVHWLAATLSLVALESTGATSVHPAGSENSTPSSSWR
jgi:hypothetical protein